MTFSQAYDAVREDVRARFAGLSLFARIEALEALVREIPLREPDTDRALVGGAIESLLKAAHVERVESCTLNFLLDLHESAVSDAGIYHDRAARAVAGAADDVLERRFALPGERYSEERDPVVTYEAKHGHALGAGTYESWRLHYRAHYSDLEYAAFLAARAEMTSSES